MAASDAEIDAIESQLLEDAASGVTSVNVDGMNVSVADPLKRLDLIERLERRRAPNASFGMRITKLISPGGGG